MSDSGYKQSLVMLLQEAYGVSDAKTGYYLDSGKAGLFGQIDKITAAQASTAVPTDAETIAGHCQHLLYTFEFFMAMDRGEPMKPDWESSWQPATVTDAEWEALKTKLRTTYNTFIAAIESREDWPRPAVGAGMMMLAHTAYHVGVIDKMLSSVS